MLRRIMRTTITVDDEIYRQAKAHAAVTGQTVGSVVEDALRDLLARMEAPRPYLVDLPTFEVGFLPGVDYNDNSALLELMDEGLTIDEMR